jgi:Sulfotransferase domain
MARFAHITRGKTGSQWVKDVLGDPRILAAANVTLRSPHRDYCMRDFANEPDRTLVAPLFHALPPDWLACKGPGDRCVVVLRDPRDAVVSAAFSNAYSHVTTPELALVRPALLALDVRGKLEVTAYLFFAQPEMDRPWAQFRSTGAELLCRFEDLLTDEHAAFRRIVDHFGWDVGDELLREVVGGMTFARRTGGRPRGENDVFSHFRNGVPGDWRNYFDRDLAERFENAQPGLLRQLGYESRDDWWTEQPERLARLGAREDEDAGALRDELERVRAELSAVRRAAARLLDACAPLDALERTSADQR